MSSCFCCFPAQLKVGVECLARRTGKNSSPGRCVHFCCGCSCAYFVSYAAEHGKECVKEVVRVEPADSSLSAMAGVKAPPQGTGECEITF